MAGRLTPFNKDELKREWDLVVCIAVAAMLAPLAILLGGNFVQTIMGLGMALLIVGYALLSVVFPRHDSISLPLRLVLSVVLSLVMLALTGFVLKIVGAKIVETTVVLIMCALVIGLSALAMLKRSTSSCPYTPPQPGAIYHWLMSFLNAGDGLDKALKVGVILMLVLPASTILFMVGTSSLTEGYTELSVLSTNGRTDNIPANYTIGDHTQFVVGISNHEGRDVHYYVEVWLVNLGQGQIISPSKMEYSGQFDVWLPNTPASIDGNSASQYSRPLNISLGDEGTYRVWLILYKDELPAGHESFIVGSDYSASLNARTILAQCVGNEVPNVYVSVRVSS